MLDHAFHSHAALRLRRWARQGTWRRMVEGNALRRGSIIRHEPWLTRIAHQFPHQLPHQFQCLSKTMAHSNPNR